MKKLFPRKALLKERDKGQFTVEYLIAFIAFALIILYVSFQMASVLPEAFMSSASNKRTSAANRVNNVLVKTGNGTIYGLARKPYSLNLTKLQDFNQACNNDYETVKEKLSLEDYAGMRITVVSNTNDYIQCGKDRIPSGISFGRARSYAYLPAREEITRLEVYVW